MQYQLLLSFSFESGHRFTFDGSKKTIVLEIKERQNNDYNTIKVMTNNVELNLSGKVEKKVND